MTKRLILSIFGALALAVVIGVSIIAICYPSPLMIIASNVLTVIVAPFGFLVITQAMNIRLNEGLRQLSRLPELEDRQARLHQTEEAQKSKEKELAALKLVINREVRRLTFESRKKDLQDDIERLGGELEKVKADLSFLNESDADIVTEEMRRIINRIIVYDNRENFPDVSD